MTPLLDTHILLYWLESGRRLSRRQRRAVADGAESGSVLVAAITLWEIATLLELDRIRLSIPLREWLERATAPPVVRVVDLTPAIATEVAALPDSFHRDPADRIIVATARVHGATLVTSDRRIIDAGIVTTLS